MADGFLREGIFVTRGSGAGRFRLAGGLGAIGLALAAPETMGQSWTGGDGNWSDASKWSTGTVPNGNAADVVIGSVVAPSTVDVDPQFGAYVRSLTIGSGNTVTTGR